MSSAAERLHQLSSATRVDRATVGASLHNRNGRSARVGRQLQKLGRVANFQHGRMIMNFIGRWSGKGQDRVEKLG